MTNRAITTSRASNRLAGIEREVLIALFRLSRDTQHISARTLADEVACTPTQTGAALVSLEQKGIVDASRARLTMKGLVLAAQLGAGSGGPRVARRTPLKVAAPVNEELPVAALPSVPPPPAPESPAPLSYYPEASVGLLS